MSDEHDNDGQSLAAWVGVGIITLGAVIMMLSVLFPNAVLFIIGAVVAVLGLVSGKVLSMAGYGANSPQKRDSVDTL